LTLDSQQHLQLNVEILDYKKSCTATFAELFPNWDFSRGFLYLFLISPEGTAKLRETGLGREAPFFACL
jgi:hypothetical protein